jgi:hypothetical protein
MVSHMGLHATPQYWPPIARGEDTSVCGQLCPAGLKKDPQGRFPGSAATPGRGPDGRGPDGRRPELPAVHGLASRLSRCVPAGDGGAAARAAAGAAAGTAGARWPEISGWPPGFPARNDPFNRMQSGFAFWARHVFATNCRIEIAAIRAGGSPETQSMVDYRIPAGRQGRAVFFYGHRALSCQWREPICQWSAISQTTASGIALPPPETFFTVS